MIKCIVIRNLRGACASVEMLKGYMLICRNAEGVHGTSKVGNPCFNLIVWIPHLQVTLLVQKGVGMRSHPTTPLNHTRVGYCFV